MLLDTFQLPIVLAPLAGGPSTPELCAAVCNAGGLGFLAAGYLPATELSTRIERTRSLTNQPFGVNVFVPTITPSDDEAIRTYAHQLQAEAQRAGVELGEPRSDDDDWEAKLELLTRASVPLVSFTFGCPSREVVSQLLSTGSEVWVTVTNVDEARIAQDAGASGLVAQGLEAGGHRGSFTDSDPGHPLLMLLTRLRESTTLPVIAAGGIMTGDDIAAVLDNGARAGALGTAFLCSPEAGTSDVHRRALHGNRETALTRAFTGRLARGIRNRFIDDYSSSAPSGYPQIHHLTAPLRAHGRAVGDPDLVNLWAGQRYPLASDLPAAEIVARVASGIPRTGRPR